MRYAFILALLAVAACTGPIKMQNPRTGQVVECGPYPSGGMAGLNTPQREAQCINDFKEQGYVRVAN